MPSYEAAMADFERHDAQVLGISVDSVPSHIAWAKSLGDITRYPLLADFHPKGDVSRKYGVWKDADGYSERAIFIIDKEGTVRHIDVHEIGEAPDSGQILDILRALNAP